MKIKAWGIRQAVWGGEPVEVWFATKEARDEYYSKHDYCDKLRCRYVNTPWVFDDPDSREVFADYDAYERARDDFIPW